MAFAVIKTGGKQYLVSVGDVLTVEKLPAAARADGRVVFDQVLLTSDDNQEVVLGRPTVAGAKVTAEILADGRSDKIRVVRYKAKIRYHKVYGHRQPFTKIKISALSTGR